MVGMSTNKTSSCLCTINLGQGDAMDMLCNLIKHDVRLLETTNIKHSSENSESDGGGRQGH